MSAVSHCTGRWAITTRAAILEQNPDIPEPKRLRVPAFVLFVELLFVEDSGEQELSGFEFHVHNVERLHELWVMMRPKQVDLILGETDNQTSLVAAIGGSDPLTIGPWRENVELSGSGPISDVVTPEPPHTLH